MKVMAKTSLFIAVIIFIFSCQTDVPIKEMAKAKKAITRAHQVKADRYDPEDLGKAEEKLYACHSQIKDENFSKSLDEAKAAYEAAKKAIEKSLPLLAKDSLDQAMALHDRALALNAEKYSPDELAAGATLVGEAAVLSNEKKYWDSHLKSTEAINHFNLAITAAEEGISALEVMIGRLKAERENLIQQDTQKSAEKELAAAGESLARAEESLKADKISEADVNATEAEQYIRAAKIKVMLLTARDKIKVLRANIENLKNERGDDYAAEEIANALGSLNEAEAFLDQEKAEDAQVKISDAENYFLAALLKTEKGMSEDKIADAEALLQKIITADSKNLFAAETGKANELIAGARQLHEAQSYRDAMVKADEALVILKSLSISIEQEYGVSPVDVQAVNYYVVRLNIKDRDCLWKIAQRMYKNARLWPLIYVANKDQIKDPDLIFPGQRFKIPPVPQKKDEAPAEQEKADSDNAIKTDDSATPQEDQAPDAGAGQDTAGAPAE
ncbi:MAG TPA: LysM peptidoglycan-binding domain-containing protein [Spirochaetota bacterium]|nr:LysM peptidoglycan-binding domain-containing protein [Spirochaetota bacterium]HPI89556.1 LysM peptidoglycan-binding domain-containing protein [Spirochaetota bacterium]HPR49020.1 LysM peptidoglycan-binding domain-containing protein [Spirochaetota bacterium]